MTLRGAGIDQTILTHSPARKHATKSLPDPEMKLEGLDAEAYLIRVSSEIAAALKFLI
jgi:hypothetical protein